MVSMYLRLSRKIQILSIRFSFISFGEKNMVPTAISIWDELVNAIILSCGGKLIKYIFVLEAHRILKVKELHK